MRNASTIVLAAGFAAVALAACTRNEQQNSEQNIAVDNGIPPGATDIETLPPDESSATPSNELQNGFVSADENDADTSNTQ